jgi:hypothetical protein
MPTHLSYDHVRAFMHLVSALSPENLHADGERTRAAARELERVIRRRWAELEAEVGRTVTEDEIWGAYLSMPRPRPVGSTYHC